METPRLEPKHGIAFAFAGILLVGYPLLAALALDWWSPRIVGAVWLALVLPGIAARRRIEGRAWAELALIALPGMCLLLWSVASDAALPLRLLPALVNATLAVVFLRTLFEEQSIIEAAARSIQPRLPDFTRPYCRLSTLIWSLFFIANALAIAWIGAFGSESAWVRYTTRGYFFAMMILGAVEYLVRKIYFRHYHGGPVDEFFAALFPARNTAAGRRSEAYIAAQREADLSGE